METGRSGQSFWVRQFGVPEVVRHASRVELMTGAPKMPQPYRAPTVVASEQRSKASRVFERSVVALVLLWICSPAALFLAIGCRREARLELEAIADRRSDVSGRKNAVLAYWMAQGVLWFWWFFLALFISCGVMVGLLFATGVVH